MPWQEIIAAAIGAWALLGTAQKLWPWVRPLLIGVKNRILREERGRLDDHEQRIHDIELIDSITTRRE